MNKERRVAADFMDDPEWIKGMIDEFTEDIDAMFKQYPKAKIYKNGLVDLGVEKKE